MLVARKIDERAKIGEQDYLDGELISEVRYEFVDGVVYAMSGASEHHGLIVHNMGYVLGDALRKQKSPCKILAESMKVRIADNSTRYFYPDILVYCENHPNDTPYYKHSPVILVEVLSLSTRKTDFILKKQDYCTIPTLQDYVVIEQAVCQVVVFSRRNEWKPVLYFLGDSITFPVLEVTVTVEDIYYQVDNGEMVSFLKERAKLEAENRAAAAEDEPAV